ncbi:hypothetical protein CYMTET_40700 [Cymbomonas tetramitiformis]|nr:hypothetical protein CYMTET_40700 [Cymbomonas tetramitiformis]
MYDWKRSSKELSPDAPHYGRVCRPPLSHLPDTAYTHYVLQQNMYAHVLRSKYGIFVEGMYLVRFHPTIKDYELVEVPRWDKEVQSILLCRARNLLAIRRFRGVALSFARIHALYRGVRVAKRLKANPMREW